MEKVINIKNIHNFNVEVIKQIKTTKYLSVFSNIFKKTNCNSSYDQIKKV